MHIYELIHEVVVVAQFPVLSTVLGYIFSAEQSHLRLSISVASPEVGSNVRLSVCLCDYI